MFFVKKSNKVDTSTMNQLPTEVKLQIIKAQTLLDETEKRLEAVANVTDLTCKRMLKDDCKSLKKSMEKFQGGGTSPALEKELELAILRLKTTSENILNWTFEG